MPSPYLTDEYNNLYVLLDASGIPEEVVQLNKIPLVLIGTSPIGPRNTPCLKIIDAINYHKKQKLPQSQQLTVWFQQALNRHLAGNMKYS